MTVHRLFDSVQINWETLTGPKPGNSTPDDRIRSGASLHRIRDDDLRSVAALECLYDQAVHRGHLRDSEAGFIRFASTAAYCIRVGDDPAALFAYLVRAGEYPATLEDEDRAMALIRGERADARMAHRWLVIRDEP